MKSKLAKALNVESITLKHLEKNMRFYSVEIHVHTHTHTHTYIHILSNISRVQTMEKEIINLLYLI